MIDVRANSPKSDDTEASIFIKNDAMVNTLYVSRNGIHVITGDSFGMLKVWDIRKSK
jgi:COMPASS component SWD3